MAQRFINPFPEWIASTVSRLEGYKLFFYETGTTTKLDTYKVAALTAGQENTNPVVLDEYGRPPYAIFLQTVPWRGAVAARDLRGLQPGRPARLGLPGASARRQWPARSGDRIRQSGA